MLGITTLGDIARILASSVGKPELACTAVSTDTRSLQPGDVFIALSGPNFDGHNFLSTAKEKGAVGAIVERYVDLELPQVVVANSVQALGMLAAYCRSRASIPIVGLTGSCGKTTTKNFIASILGLNAKVLATEGNFNNHIGLPLTLLNLVGQHDYAVIEMGASALNEISYLTAITKPDVALITNIAAVHLDGFGSVAGVAQGKSEIFQGLNPDGCAIINADVTADHWPPKLTHRVLSFGIDNSADIYATNIRLTDSGCAAFTLHGLDKAMPLQLQLLGKHNVYNALAAAAVGHALQIPSQQIVDGLAALNAVGGRLVRHETATGAIIIDDTYNANPTAAVAALDILAQYPGKKILVMADMGGLGVDDVRYHQLLGQQARAVGIDNLFAVGCLCRHMVAAFGESAQLFNDQESLVQELKAHLSEPVTVLVKGSRAQHMERVVTQLLAPIS